MKIKKELKSKISSLEYITVTLLILCSGSAIGIVYGTVLYPLFPFSSVLLMFLSNKSIIKENLFVSLIFMIGYIINLLIFMNRNAYYINYFIYCISIISVMLICSNISFNRFKDIFINVIVVISLYSLIMFILGKMYNLIQYSSVHGDLRIFLGFNFWSITSNRNSGVFWEPGGYQIFLNLALFFLLTIEKSNIKQYRIIKITIIFISIITTKSTIGYIVLGIIIIINIINNINKQNIFKKILLFIICIPMIVFIIYIIASSNVVYEKISNTNGSFIARSNHLSRSIDVIAMSPIIGLGIGTNIKKSLELQYNLTKNSVGILASIINFGLIYMGIYISRVYYFCKINFVKNLLPIIIILCLFWISQAIFEFPIMYIFLFKFMNDIKTKERISFR